MSSVNKIKELAENGDYSLALDILEHQDLSKSLSPQFIRICGEVYYENQKYPEARAALVKAHSMAPMGNKIIFSIIKLYLSMGLFQLAEYYFEIYKFNQNTRDVGTLRIEYLIAKAYRKSIIELYSILISANEMETDEEWDLEMLFIHAAMKNSDKLRNESSIFKATYKNSTKLNEIEILLQDMDKASEYIYIYPENAVEDTDETMEETRQLEKKILDEDNLRMNPKDPKIMIMVEDDEPVPSSVKLKTMFSRSKENKREKKERKAEGKEEKTGWFGKNRMSKKDEEAFEETVKELAEGDAGKQEILDEVLKSDDAIEQTGDKISGEMVEITDISDISDKVVYNNNVDDIAEKIFDEAMDDFSLDDDIETVVMVDVDSLSDEDETVSDMTEVFEPKETDGDVDIFESEETDESEAELEAEETAEPEAELEAEETAEAVVELEAEETAEPVAELEAEETAEPEVELEAEETAEPVAELETEEAAEPEVEFENEPVAEFENEETAEPVAELETEETAESEAEFENEEVKILESEDAEKFDFDSAFESLDGFETNGMSESVENIEAAEEPKMEEPISEKEPDTDYIVFNENETDSFNHLEYESDTDAIPMVEISEKELFDDIFDESDGFESDFSDESEKIVEVVFEEDSDVKSYDEPEPEEAETEPEAYDEPEPEEAETEPEAYDEPEPEEAETEPEAYDEPEPEEVEPVTEKEPKAEEKPENLLYRRNIDFPVFKTSLFPDYNRDNPPVYTPSKKKVDEVNSEQEKIKENLKKEEDLLSETDRLLARLGIELGTDYHSGVDFKEQSYDSIKSYDNVRTPGTEEKADMKDKNPFKLRF